MNEPEQSGLITKHTFENYRCILNFYYTNLHRYMSLIDILKHAVEHNTWNNTHTLQHRQVQVVA